MQTHPLCIGHRGACGYEPENTLLSFTRAIEIGVDIIELDVRFSKDKQLVVIHDDTIDRTTNGHGAVRDFTLKELQAFDAGKGEHIPTLREVFELVQRKAIINIELKDTGTALAVSTLTREYLDEHNWHVNDFIVSSFNRMELTIFHQQLPSIPLAILFSQLPSDIIGMAQSISATYIGINKDILTTQELAQKLQHTRLTVFVWTVNDPTEISRFVSMGVNGICSDFPDRVVKAVKKPNQ